MTKLLKDDRLRNWKPRICRGCGKPLPKGAKRWTCGIDTQCYRDFQSFRQAERWRLRRTPPPAKFMGFPDPKLCQLVDAYTDPWPGTGTCWQSNLAFGQGGGQPRIRYNGGYLTLQQASWLGFHGPIEEDEIILNACDNPRCGDPDHIYKGTLADKERAKLERGRGPGGYVTEDQGEEIRALYLFTDISQQELADKFELNNASISNIVNFKGRWANRKPTTEEADALKKKRYRLPRRPRRFTDNQIRDIRARLNSGQSAPAVAKEFDTDSQAILMIKWKRGTYADVE